MRFVLSLMALLMLILSADARGCRGGGRGGCGQSVQGGCGSCGNVQGGFIVQPQHAAVTYAALPVDVQGVPVQQQYQPVQFSQFAPAMFQGGVGGCAGGNCGFGGGRRR